jgi:hypothetical protein
VRLAVRRQPGEQVAGEQQRARRPRARAEVVGIAGAGEARHRVQAVEQAAGEEAGAEPQEHRLRPRLVAHERLQAAEAGGQRGREVEQRVVGAAAQHEQRRQEPGRDRQQHGDGRVAERRARGIR